MILSMAKLLKTGGVRLLGEINLMEGFCDCICAPINWFKMLATGLQLESRYLGSLCHLSSISYIVRGNKDALKLLIFDGEVG